jgi:porin
VAPRRLLAAKTLLTIVLAGAGALAQETRPASRPAGEREGVLEVEEYGGEFSEREYLTGDWGGTRRDWAERGLSFDFEWTQVLQGIVKGGIEQKWAYEGSLDYIVKADLMRMGVVPGALVTLRGESRYGDSINDFTGLIYPANLDGLVPLTSPPDEPIPFTITELNLRQRVVDGAGFLVGKIQNLDIDFNEFASGRGRYQFMNLSFVVDPALALTTPYSTLAAGVFWEPGPELRLTSTLMNTDDSSTTTGFNDFGKGATWSSEATTQYKLLGLPGGGNALVNYAFGGDFRDVNTLAGGIAGVPTTASDKSSSWAVSFSAWQYLFTKESPDVTIDITDGRQDLQGIGVFSRVGFADTTTNPVDWFASIGFTGRGLIPGRDEDSCGIAYAYNDIQDVSQIAGNLLDRQTEVFELYYDVAVLGSVNLTADFQWIRGAFTSVDASYIVGFRLNIRF